MSSHLKDRQEKILQILIQLADESAKGTTIIVEGKKDIFALREFNVIGPILTAKTGGKSLAEILLEIENERLTEVILLFDFDSQGQKLTRRFKLELERAQVKPNVTFWRVLLALVGREIQCIEGLPSFMKTLERKIM